MSHCRFHCNKVHEHATRCTKWMNCVKKCSVAPLFMNKIDICWILENCRRRSSSIKSNCCKMQLRKITSFSSVLSSSKQQNMFKKLWHVQRITTKSLSIKKEICQQKLEIKSHTFRCNRIEHFSPLENHDCRHSNISNPHVGSFNLQDSVAHSVRHEQRSHSKLRCVGYNDCANKQKKWRGISKKKKRRRKITTAPEHST